MKLDDRWVALDEESAITSKNQINRSGLRGQVLGWFWPWHKVPDEFPIERDNVLIVTKGYNIRIADYIPDEGFFTHDGAKYQHVRFWSNLPEITP